MQSNRGMRFETSLDAGAFAPNYFSMEDIIASQTKVPCKTEVNLPNFGFLDPGLNSEDLPRGSELEFSIWAAAHLTKPSRRYAVVGIPRNYKESYRAVLKADPTVVDLNRLGPHFYQTGLHIAALPHNESDEVAEILPEILQLRLQKIADSYSFSSQMNSGDEGSSSKKGNIMKESHLDRLERQIFNEARNSAEAMKDWFENTQTRNGTER